MKKLLYLTAILAIIFSANCSKIPENNDPIIGIWKETEELAESTSKSEANVKKEWIFNDVYLGRFHEYTNGEITLLTDFSWTKENDIYTVTYSVKNSMPVHSLKIVNTKDGEILQLIDGNVLAKKE